MKQYTNKEMADMNDDTYIHEFQNEGFNWFAVDKNGSGHEYVTEPGNNSLLWTYNSCYSKCNKVDHKYTGDWMKSLQERGIAIDNDTLKADEKKPAEWVDGLPPIGEVCEYKLYQDWCKCKIIGWDSDGFLVFEDMNEGNEISYEGTKDFTIFRPILTPKQRTIEAAVKTLGYDCKTEECELYGSLVEIYDKGMLTLPGESK